MKRGFALSTIEKLGRKFKKNEDGTHFHTKEELFKYLTEYDWEAKKETAISSVYFLVSYEDELEPIGFFEYEGYWFESPCTLISFPMAKDEIEAYVKGFYRKEAFSAAFELSKSMYRDGCVYQIENFQTVPFLPDEITIIKDFTDSECLDWMLKN